MKVFLTLIIFHLGLLVVTRFIAWPENLLWPYLNQNGVEYYKGLFLIYSPVYWWSLSLFYKFFGIGLYQLMAFSWSIVIVTDILLFLVGKKKIWPLLLYIPLQVFFEGNGVWVDHLLAPLFLAAFYFWRTKKFFWFGITLGVSLMTKQTALYVTLFAFGAFFLKRDWKGGGQTFVGVAVPVIAVAIYLFLTDGLVGFWDSAVRYILLFHSRYPLQTQLPTLSQLPTLVLLIMMLGLAAFKKDGRQLVPWIIFASLGVFTRFEYFHLQPALPFIALAISSAGVMIFPYVLFLVFFGRFFIHNTLGEPRFLGKETLGNARAINAIIGEEKRIMVVNSWDHYYFLTRTLPTNLDFVPSTPWTMDYPENERRFSQSLGQHPKFIIYNDCLFVKDLCYRPKGVTEVLEKEYLKRLELPDGTSVFEYHPMSPSEKTQSQN